MRNKKSIRQRRTILRTNKKGWGGRRMRFPQKEKNGDEDRLAIRKTSGPKPSFQAMSQWKYRLPASPFIPFAIRFFMGLPPPNEPQADTAQ